jgi:SAM-dependent methyltransferase
MNAQTTQHVLLEACPVCGGGEWRVLAAYPEMTWVTCSCGLIYRRSQLCEQTESSRTEALYGSTLRTRYMRGRRHRVHKARRQILDALNHVDVPTPVLLDIGCSAGYTLLAGQLLGLRSTGVDINTSAVETARKAGLDARVGSLTSLPFTDASFDVVMAKHVLEHSTNPRAALREIRRVLRPLGVVFIAVPHADYIKARLCPLRSRFYLPKRNAHYVYYRPESLRRLLIDEGFSVRRVNRHLLHRRSAMHVRLLQVLIAPFLWPIMLLMQIAQLQKEFWVVAQRT